MGATVGRGPGIPSGCRYAAQRISAILGVFPSQKKDGSYKAMKDVGNDKR